MKKKLMSRKFWITVLGMGISILGGITSDNATVQTICTVSSAVFGMLYMIIEGTCDVAGIKKYVNTAMTAIDEYNQEKQNNENTEDK